MMTSSGQSACFFLSRSRLKCSRKSVPRRGTDTGASWKVQVYTLESEPQENCRGMIGEPSAVRRCTLLTDEDLGPGNTKTEAPESTKISRTDRISFMKMRDELQKSSRAEVRGGEPAGWTRISTCWTASFPTWNTVSCS